MVGGKIFPKREDAEAFATESVHGKKPQPTTPVEKPSTEVETPAEPRFKSGEKYDVTHSGRPYQVFVKSYNAEDDSYNVSLFPRDQRYPIGESTRLKADYLAHIVDRGPGAPEPAEDLAQPQQIEAAEPEKPTATTKKPSAK